uniref:Response regulator containing chey-like receiver, AAA-type ATPase, and DNA-binding domains n=1 Tax=uncultured gamma proteobacterium HF0070_08D07 TaxID=710983 RepID=E0XRX1_9GAMM|nr:response regulator containing chey-like receiver, AAA-type ATPase, and DNA-binding domains [uncultured gamma proteobacterium HF0070_08D07]
MAEILCITDNKDFLEVLTDRLEDFGIPVFGSTDHVIEGRPVNDILVIDYQVFLSAPKRIDFLGPVFVFSNKPSIKQAVECIRVGAREYFDISQDISELVSAVRDEMSLSTKEKISSYNIDEIVGTSYAISSLREQLTQVYDNRQPVLIYGEIGTGKSLAAKTIHANGEQFQEPFFSIDCSSASQDLLEAELFGGEARNQPGLLQINDGRTVYLKEISALDESAQALLRNYLKQENGHLAPRIIAGSSNALEPLVESTNFDSTLFLRLNENCISIASLREREDDPMLLACYLLKKSQRRLQKTGLKLSEDARTAIRQYEWPGNVNELENALDRATILTKSNSLIHPQQLAIGSYSNTKKDFSDSGQEVNESLESYFLSFVLDNQDSMTETQLAGKLGISRKSLWERRQRLNIPRTKTRKRGPRIERNIME